MSNSISNIGSKAVAVAVLLIAGWILLKLVVGVVTFVFWTVLGILAVVAVLWALNRLL